MKNPAFAQLAYPRFLLLLLWIAWPPGYASAQLPTIEVGSLSVAAAQAGTSIELSIGSGNRTEEVERFLFSSEGFQQRSIPSEASAILGIVSNTGRSEITILDTAAKGLCEVRAVGRFGVSNPRRLLVTSTPVQYVATEPTSLDKSEKLQVGQILFDHCSSRNKNFYSLQLTAGDQFQCVAYADAIDSRAVLATQLLDSSGHIVASDRAVGAWPAEMRYTATETGEYFVVAYDFLFQGGGDYPFVLEFSKSANPTETPDFELDRLLRPTLLNRGLTVTKDNSAADAEPKDVFRTLPFQAIGSFANIESVSYDFEGKAGQPHWIEVQSAQLDQRTDPRLIVYKLAADGKEAGQILEQDDGPSVGGPAMRIKSVDPYVRFQIPDSGRFRVELRDNEGGPRPADSQGFVLSIREESPSFTVLAYLPFETNNLPTSRNHGSNLMLGGTQAIQVLALRQDGFSAPIELEIEGLPTSITYTPAVIRAGETEASLVLNRSVTATSGEGDLSATNPNPLALRVVASANIQGSQVRCQARVGTINWPASPSFNAIRTRPTDEIVLGLNPWDTAPLLSQLGDGSTLEMARGGKIPLKITLHRRDGGKASCVLRPQSLPPKTTLGEIAIAADKSEASAELVIAPDAPTFESTFWLQNETKLKWRTNPQALERVEAQLAQLKSGLKAAQDAESKKPVEAAIQSVNQQIEVLKQQTAEQEYTVFLPSTLQRIRIVDAPFDFSASDVQIVSGKPCEVQLKIVRKFEFADALDVNLIGEAPAGWKITRQPIAAGADSAKLLIEVPAETEQGIRQLPIKLDYKFSGHSLSVTRSIELNIVHPSL